MKTLYKRPLTLVSKETIRSITVGAFRRRLTIAEKVSINTSEDPVVYVLKEDLFSSTGVDLDFPQLIAGLDYLVSIGILTPERKVALLADGTVEET